MKTVSDTPVTLRSTSGVPGLDDILGGGFIPNRLYLIDGNPGAGKTTLAMQYMMEGARRGEKCLYVTLSETREELESVAVSHGWSLAGVEILELIANETELNTDTQLTMYHPAEVELNQTTRTIIEHVNQVNPSRVVVDSLAELRMLAQNSLRYRRQILALKQFFIGRQSTVLLLDDHTASGTDKQLQSIAHGVIDLEQVAVEFGGQRRRVTAADSMTSALKGAGWSRSPVWSPRSTRRNLPARRSPAE
jgi:circadian clock protein KaiC